ncbi:hypothetical protein [Algoriphagus namhaensis]
METIVIESTGAKESEAIKAFLKAQKINFRSTNTLTLEAITIASDVVEGYKEAMSIQAGKTVRKSYSSFKDIIDEL